MPLKFWTTIILSFTLAALSLLGFGFVTAKVGQMENALSAIADDIATLEKERRAAEGFFEFTKKRDGDMRAISGFYITRARPVRLLEDLERTAADASTTISVTVDEAESTDSALLFQISVSGSESRILQFLRLIEFLPYDIAVHAASLQFPGRRRQSALEADEETERRADATMRIRVATAPQ